MLDQLSWHLSWKSRLRADWRFHRHCHCSYLCPPCCSDYSAAKDRAVDFWARSGQDHRRLKPSTVAAHGRMPSGSSCQLCGSSSTSSNGSDGYCRTSDALAYRWAIGYCCVVLWIPGAVVDFVLVCREFPALRDSSLSLSLPAAPTTSGWVLSRGIHMMIQARASGRWCAFTADRLTRRTHISLPRILSFLVPDAPLFVCSSTLSCDLLLFTARSALAPSLTALYFVFFNSPPQPVTLFIFTGKLSKDYMESRFALMRH